jgi:hypothetical protein
MGARLLGRAPDLTMAAPLIGRCRRSASKRLRLTQSQTRELGALPPSRASSGGRGKVATGGWWESPMDPLAKNARIPAQTHPNGRPL